MKQTETQGQQLIYGTEVRVGVLRCADGRTRLPRFYFIGIMFSFEILT
jgi:hypothetical protein